MAIAPSVLAFAEMARRDDQPDSDLPPPPSTRAEEERGRRGESEERRRRIETVIPELLKKAVERGVDRAAGSADALRSYINDTKLPKEIASALLSQIDDTKNGLFRVVAKEIRGFLEAIDFQHELQKLLTTVSFEIKTEIRFIPNDSAPEKIGRPEVKAGMKVKRNDARDAGAHKKSARKPEAPTSPEPARAAPEEEEEEDDLPGGLDDER